MATEGDREIAPDRAVQRTSKERPPLHLQNLGLSVLRKAEENPGQPFTPGFRTWKTPAPAHCERA